MSTIQRIIKRLTVAVGSRLQSVESAGAASTLPKFAAPAPGLVIRTPRDIGNPQLIRFGRNVKIGPNSVVKATTRFPGSWLRHPEERHLSQEFSPAITFGDRVTATWALQVVAFERITIEDDVMFAGNIYISDGQHGTNRGDVPYKYQGIEGISPVTIGKGSWIGQNVVILPGVTIGENAIIGANSVVSSSVPARSLAVGAPARVVKSWDTATSSWKRAAEAVAEHHG
jgi:acetyltransferase-like isoleucine patch superfamily enzyme